MAKLNFARGSILPTTGPDIFFFPVIINESQVSQLGVNMTKLFTYGNMPMKIWLVSYFPRKINVR